MIESAIKLLVPIFLYIPRRIGIAILEWLYRGPNEALPPIREDCLLLSATTIAARIRTKKLTSVEVIESCIRRIEEINDISNCVIAKRYEEALEEARRADQIVAEGSKSVEELERDTPFLGVPFSIKDSIAIKGMPQTAGVVGRRDVKATEDSAVVKLMRKAGAIPLAVTNVPEMMMAWETSNLLYGLTRNPYHSNHTAGGSSGGEGALLAAAGSPMGIGSDIGGSIRIPAYMCGIFGHKPSPQLVPCEGKFPESTTETKKFMSVIGPMSKSATDLRQVFKILAQDSKIDLKLNEKVDIKKLRFFYMDGDINRPFFSGIESVHPAVKNAMQMVVDYFYKTYGISVERVNFEEFKNMSEIWFSKLKTDNLSSLQSDQGILSFIWDLLKSIVGLANHTLPLYLLGLCMAWVPAPGTPQHKQFITEGESLRTKFQDLLKDDGVFFFPTQPTPPVVHYSSVFRLLNVVYTFIFNVTGMPATQFPVTQTEKGLPIGIQVAAARNQDRLTLAVAEEMEKAFGGWKPPLSKTKW